ncbi:MAG TPA: hypothetical protein VM076_14555 [Gemmatimonadaceae bacterium]|nr:hypothetical protein [Gemmatimonadaceae bacterium]
MRKPPRRKTWLMVACATAAAASHGRAQQVDPYPQTLQFGAGFINTPAAWVSRRTADSWLTLAAKDLPSFGDGSQNGLASRLNSNLALDTHWGGRVSLGVSLYSQNPEWGAFGQALLVRDGDLGFLPAIAVGARNVGKYKHEDRFLIGHDIVLDSAGGYDQVVAPRYESFKTSPTLYAVMTKDVPLSGYSEAGRNSMSFSVGYGNGLFREDGGLGDRYNNSGTIAKGLFLGSRFVSHPSSNSTLTVLAENDGWDWNAGVVAEWRGVSVGIYGTELEAGRRNGEVEGFNVYNYTKVNFAIGYTGNVRDISHGVVLRSRITELTREQRRLKTEIVSRERRIKRLEGQLVDARQGELARLDQRRVQLETQVQAEREAIKRATDRLRELEAGGRPTPKPQPPPTSPQGAR